MYTVRYSSKEKSSKPEASTLGANFFCLRMQGRTRLRLDLNPMIIVVPDDFLQKR